jgi:hypothetical protein
MPVKNEASILPITLPIISQYCDHVIIADQMSTDGSREIYKKFPKVSIIDNHRRVHSNEVRWDLLQKAREFGNNNLILCLDADEYIPPDLFKNFLDNYDFKPGDSFRFPWIQLWKSPDYFNNTGVWFKNYQRACWMDDGFTNYTSNIVINDHTSRVPEGFLNKNKKIEPLPIIHLQWVFWDKTQLKQAWYRCTELIQKPSEYKKINTSYAHSLDKKTSALERTPHEWIQECNNLPHAEIQRSWHLKEILNFFDEKGVDFFEPLQIWHIKELRDTFIQQKGREPVSVTESRFINIAKDFKTRMIKIIKS